MAFVPRPPGSLWKKAWQVTRDTVRGGVGYLTTDYLMEMNAAGVEEDDPPASSWRKFVAKWEDTTSIDTADDQFMSWEVYKQGADGTVDGDWNTGNYEYVCDRYAAIVAGIAPYTVSRLRCTEIAAYVRAYAPYTEYQPGSYYRHFVDSGAPDFVRAMTQSGSGIGDMPPQVSSTVTEETSMRKHWGRTYLPTPSGTYFTGAGRLATTYVDTITALFHDQYVLLQEQDMVPCVASTMANQVPAHVLMSVTGVRADDVADVVRRRRFKHPLYHKIRPTPAAAKLPEGIPPFLREVQLGDSA